MLKAAAEAEAKGFTAPAVCLGALPNQTKNSEQLACQINNSMEMLYIAELCHICLNSNLNINGGFLLFGQKQLQWIEKITVGLIHKKLLWLGRFFLRCIIPYDINENHTFWAIFAFGRRTWEEKNVL